MNIRNATLTSAPQAQPGLLLARSLSCGDLEAATACFARDGCLVTADATAIHGRERIRPLLAQLLDRRPEIEIELSNAIRGGDVLFASERWRVRSGGRDRVQVTQTWHPTLVLRRTGTDWRLAVAAPWGWGQRWA